MELGTGITVLGAALGSKELVVKMLGPTADYLGIGLKNWTEKRIQNVARIFLIARAKLGETIDNAGAVPPRVLKEILDEGSYCADELTAEYFGGVLASSRSPNGRDDRGATYLRLTSELSTYQIRFHYLCYSYWRKLFLNSGLRPTFVEDLKKMAVCWPYSSLLQDMEFSGAEAAMNIILHCTTGLGRLDLLKAEAWGQAGFLNDYGKQRGWKSVQTDGIVICPTQFGLDYFLWATGCGQTNYSRFLDREIRVSEVPNIQLTREPVKLLD